MTSCFTCRSALSTYCRPLERHVTLQTAQQPQPQPQAGCLAASHPSKRTRRSPGSVPRSPAQSAQQAVPGQLLTKETPAADQGSANPVYKRMRCSPLSLQRVAVQPAGGQVQQEPERPAQHCLGGTTEEQAAPAVLSPKVQAAGVIVQQYLSSAEQVGARL